MNFSQLSWVALLYKYGDLIFDMGVKVDVTVYVCRMADKDVVDGCCYHPGISNGMSFRWVWA
jgi:hypothetical protein